MRGSSTRQREQNEAKAYNKFIKLERKIALPPVNEALYLNCDLLFALANKLNVSATEKNKIESMIHENGANIFLTNALDDKFWFDGRNTVPASEDTSITFDGEKLIIPVTYTSERSLIQVTISGPSGDMDISDWKVSEVIRPKKADVSEFTVTYKSKIGKEHKYKAGDSINIKITPVSDSPDNYIEFKYDVIGIKKLKLFDGIKFERILK